MDADFEGNMQNAADAISDAFRSNYKGNRDYKDITASILYAILADKSHIKFSQLEMIASYIGIPVGAMLFLTRVRASQRDGNLADIEYLKSVHSLIVEAFMVERVTYQSIKEIGSGNKQLSLFDGE